MDKTSSKKENHLFILKGEQFKEWTSLNDTIMGGKSQATCTSNSSGLHLEGILIEEGGGFVSCRSPIFSPPLNLAKFSGLSIEVDGEGRTLKFAVGSKENFLGIKGLIPGGVSWITQIPTNLKGTTSIKVPFNSLQPTIRAKRINFPIRFNPSQITKFQLLHSKFGEPGELNRGFKPGKLKIILRSITSYF